MLVEFPQAFRQMLPIIIAQLVVLLKDTSLGYIVGYVELLRVNLNYLSSFYGNRYLFSLFIVTLVLYLVMNLSLSWFARWVSRRTASKSSGMRLDPEDPNQHARPARARCSSACMSTSCEAHPARLVLRVRAP
jgi:glutamate transport system permease protein